MDPKRTSWLLRRLVNEFHTSHTSKSRNTYHDFCLEKRAARQLAMRFKGRLMIRYLE
jgi:hypothetical protein